MRVRVTVRVKVRVRIRVRASMLWVAFHSRLDGKARYCFVRPGGKARFYGGIVLFGSGHNSGAGMHCGHTVGVR